MALNAKKVAKAGGFRQPPIAQGSYPARVVQLIDLGVQPQKPYKGKEKPPAHFISLTYELLDEFCVDEEGKELEDKPRWISEDMPFYNLEADKARSTMRYMAIDPNQDFEGEFTMLVGQPCIVTITHNPNPTDPERPYCNVGNVSSMREKQAKSCAELVNKPVCFTLDDPDMEAFNNFQQWVQDKISSNLEFKGSPLEKLIGTPAPKEESPKASEPEPSTGDDDDEKDW
jgi:hypothetical protein